MKKLFFYSNIEYEDNTIGITKKVKAQVKAFVELGYEVSYSCYYKDFFAIIDGESNRIISSQSNKYYNTKINHALRRFMLMKYVTEWIRDKQFEIIYLRYHYFDKYSLNLLKQAKESAERVIMEMHSYPCLGTESLRDKVFTKLENRYQDSCVQHIDLFANMSSNRLPFDKPQIQIRNTIDPDSIFIRHPMPADGILHMLSVAYERPAHGFDRVVKGLAEYYNKGGEQEVQIVFAGKYLGSTRQLVIDTGMEKNCKFIPPVSGKELDNLYDQANIAIGHLANHRVNSFSGSAIKTQEFLAKGIPFIYAWEESMIPSNYPYALKFELAEEAINFERVVEWWKTIDNNTEIIARKMRAFFDEDAGWEKQLRRLIEKEPKSSEQDTI